MTTAPWTSGPGEPLVRDARSAGRYAYGDPTVAEQVSLEAINRARLNPEQEAADCGIDLNEGLAQGTLGTPVQPLTFNASLLTSARNHSLDMMANNYMEHTSLDGTTPYQRMANAGFLYSCASENIAWVGSTGPMDEIAATLFLHQDLFVDDTVNGRGHRLNILDPDFREVGVGIVSGAFTLYESGAVTYPYSYMLTYDFGTSREYSQAFILGVVFDDKNRDTRYSAGEGKSDVVIEVLQGTGLKADTVTATAGGYALPMAPGNYTVRATLPDERTAEKNVNLSTVNVKVDFLTQDFQGNQAPGSSGGGGGGCFISGLLTGP
ncbi:MAG: CAP domain-containing protein [Pseudomonadota bacterium]